MEMRLTPSETKALVAFYDALEAMIFRRPSMLPVTSPVQGTTCRVREHTSPTSSGNAIDMSDAVRDIFAEWSPPDLSDRLDRARSPDLFAWVVGLRRDAARGNSPGIRLASFLDWTCRAVAGDRVAHGWLADTSLSAHMVEHLLLMSAVPPLLLYGLPLVPLLRGLPKVFRRYVIGPLLNMPITAFTGTMAVNARCRLARNELDVSRLARSRAYDFALEHETWHDRRTSLLSKHIHSVLVVHPLALAARKTSGNGGGSLSILISADVVNTLLSAFLAFCGRPVYSFYVDHPNPFHLSPLEDQVLGAVIMWVIGSLAFLIPAVVITMRSLRPTRLV